MLLWSLLLDLITAVTHGSKSEQTHRAVYSFEEQPLILPSTNPVQANEIFLKNFMPEDKHTLAHGLKVGE